MESGNHLGIYLRKNRATVVCLAPPGRERRVAACFSVSLEGESEQNQQVLADRIAAACRERKIKFTDAAVALDCASFMQHTVHSEFSDPRRIAATIRFDTEEALATDISEMAVAFRVTSTGDEGAQLDVFTAQRAILSDLLLSLQSNGIDPMTVDPDVCCLARYLAQYGPTPAAPEQSTLHALLSDSRGYLVLASPTRQAPLLRTFLIGPAQERNALLAREMLVTTALIDTGHPVKQIDACDAQGRLVPASLRQGTGLDVGLCDLPALAGVQPGDLPDGVNAVDFALACGAALAPAQKADSVNFRNDHMPYLGRKRRLQNAVRLLSISVTILLLAVGVYVHSHLIRVNQQRERLHDKLEEDYLPAIPGKTKMPTPMRDALAEIERTLRILRSNKEGPGANHESVSAKLTLVLQGLSACARQADLNITSITITGTSITISGDTSSRHNTTETLGAALKEVGLLIDSHDLRADSGRDAFTIRLKFDPAKIAKGA